MMAQHQVLQFQCVKQKMPVMQMCGKMTRGALTGPTHCKGTSTLRLWDNTKQQSSRQSRRRKRFLRGWSSIEWQTWLLKMRWTAEDPMFRWTQMARRWWSVVGERAVYLWKAQSGRISRSWTGCNHDQLSKHQAQWWSNQEGQWIIVQEFMSAVCGVDANDEEHENRHGSLESVMNSRTSQPLVLNIIQCSRHVQRFLRCVREEWERTRTSWRRLRWRRRRPQQKSSQWAWAKLCWEARASTARWSLWRLVYHREEDTSSGEGAELAKREIDEMTSRVRWRFAAASCQKEEEGKLSTSCGSWDKNILMDSEVKLFQIYVLMKLFYVTEPNDLLHCVVDGMYVNDQLDTVLEIAGTGQRPWVPKVQMKPSVTKRLLETWVSTLRVRDGKQTGEELRLMQSHEDSDWRESSLGDSVSGEDTLRRERLIYFQQILENSMETSEGRSEQLWKTRCRATWQMQIATRSTTTAEKGEQQHIDHLQTSRMRRIQQDSCRGSGWT